LAESVFGAAVEVHRLLGPELLEAVYQAAMLQELRLRSIPVPPQVQVPVSYKGVELAANLRLDLLIADQVIVGIKAVDSLLPVHHAQLLTYLRLSGKELGLLLNFIVPLLLDGIKRVALSAVPLRTSASSAPLQ
jgi:GxxExxY protein